MKFRIVKLLVAGSALAAVAVAAGAAMIASAAVSPASWQQVAKRASFPVYRPGQTLGLPLTALGLSPCSTPTGFMHATYGTASNSSRHVDLFEAADPLRCGNPGESRPVTSAVINGVNVPVSVYCAPNTKCTAADGFNNGFLVFVKKPGAGIGIDSARVSLSDFLTLARSLSPVAPSNARLPGQPVFGRTAEVAPVAGVVLIEPPGQKRFARLSSASTVPLRTLVDATHGTVMLTSATGTGQQTQTGQFAGGIFRITQTRSRSAVRGGKVVGLTVLTLAGQRPTGCTTPTPSGSGSAVIARHRPTTRRLWGDGHGSFQTTGTNASATVRGTKWLTEDSCAGTLVKVARGVVSVLDFRTHKTVLLRAGGSFLARSRPASAPRAAINFWPSVAAIIRAPGQRPLLEVIRPSIIFIFADGSWDIDHLHWSGWGSTVAHATGISSASNGIPDQASGKRIKKPAEITLSNPGPFFGRRVYRCFSLTVPSLPASDQHRCLAGSHGYWGFS